MKIHLIAIGGSAMHNMALALKKKGYSVSGSDDEINEPSKSRLENAGILPENIGWFPEKINQELDAVIVGMHARADNPELLKAKNIGLKIYSYPEYIYEQSRNKIRVVIGGSHGKTTITSMILHVLGFYKKDFDYLVGAQLKGFDTMVKFSEDAPFMIIEGDEYLSSPIDTRPKFHLYHPNIALISGIAWDHINVFPTFDIYVDQFRKFIQLVSDGGKLIYCNKDEVLKELTEKTTCKGDKIAYEIPEYSIENGTSYLFYEGEKYPMKIFGEHNLMNLEGASKVCESLGISIKEFIIAMQSFEGAAKRLELVRQSETFTFYKDFAHSPSKLKATINAVKKQFPNRKLTAVIELHTFSSLNENFLAEYKDSMNEADEAIVYFNPHTIQHKKLKAISPEQVKESFGQHKNLSVYTDSSSIAKYLELEVWENRNLLMMSSGNFDGVNFEKLGSMLKCN
ncbi:MAG: UDP-N-acetylmuramate--L-alanine ligase [Bacteroidota bacterium]|jgi:UDP-N-acetylmuramate: L-alanyl-gamma-D-glutamyl-meso-diaminopimelate ligase